MVLFKRRIVKPGLYNYIGSGKWAGLKLHLRVLKDGTGILVINADRILYLNETATAYVKFFMNGKTVKEAIKEIRRYFKVKPETVREDYMKTLYTINTIASTKEVCPISYLGVERIEPFSKDLNAPLRMDLALTYKCNNNCIHCYAGEATVERELTTEEWKKVIDKIYSLGIPQILFTGGEPTLRKDLVELVAYSQKVGLVTGLVTNGRKLSDKKLVSELVKAGLDYAQITLESHKPELHDKITQVPGSWSETVAGIKNMLETTVYVSVNMTLNKWNIKEAIEIVDFLHELGLPRFSCNGLIYAGKGTKIAEEFAVSEKELLEILPKIRDKAHEYNMEFTWFTPTKYCKLNPIELGLGIKCCTAAKITMCIEPDGDVLPCQSYFENVGNILRDKWEKIWNHPLCISIRKREYAPEGCRECVLFSVCGAGCPLELKAKRVLCGECFES